MGSPTQEIAARLKQEWQDGTTHPFLDGCADGSVSAKQFGTWLVQDFMFVLAFTRFMGSVLSKAPESHLHVLLDGTKFIQDELTWFRAKMAERGLDAASAPQHGTCARYCRFLDSLGSRPYADCAVAFWAIEAMYLEAWAGVLAKNPETPYKEFAMRWASDGFRAYVAQLRQQADEAVASLSSGNWAAQAEDLVRDICVLEKEFWGMAWGA